MLTNINIQLLTTEYVPDVAQIEASCFSIPWSEKAIADELNNDFAKIIIAVDTTQNKAIGYVSLHILAGEGDVLRVAILPQYRKMGIARSMLLYGFQWVQGPVFLDVRQGNIPAISLYKSLGFSQIGIRKNYYQNPTENAVLMKREYNNENIRY